MSRDGRQDAREGLKGFEPEWKDVPDYIIGITRRIWEDRDFGSLKRYYGDDMLLRLPTGIYRGNRGALAKVLSTLSEFPDRQLLGEDVIWCPVGEDALFSSHRSLTVGTHAGAGLFGPPTGKRTAFRAIADCYATANAITDEWVVRDYGAVARQLGVEPREAARLMIEEEGGHERAARPFQPADDEPGPYAGTGNDSEWAARYRAVLQGIMDADLAIIPREYDRACHLEYPGGRTLHSHEGADAFWIALRASLPSATFTVHHALGRDDAMMPPRAALRWSLHGRHDGRGMLGAPTGANVYVMGISHAEFGPRGLRREWVVIDEVSIHKQVLLATG